MTAGQSKWFDQANKAASQLSNITVNYRTGPAADEAQRRHIADAFLEIERALRALAEGLKELEDDIRELQGDDW